MPATARRRSANCVECSPGIRGIRTPARHWSEWLVCPSLASPGPRSAERAFSHRHHAIGRNILQTIHLPARPTDLDRVDPRSAVQTEMQARIVRCLVAHSSLGFINLSQPCGSQLHARPNAVAIGANADEAQLDPMLPISAV